MRKCFIPGLVLVAGAAGVVLLLACTQSATTPVSTAPPASESQVTAATTQNEAQSAEYRKAQAEAEAKARADREKFMDEDIYFKKGSYALDADAQEILKRKAEWLRNNPDVVVMIEGYTDEPGSKEYNLALGDRRAGAVKTFFLNEGIATERLIPISYGKEHPLVAGGSEADQAKNRRVHIAIE
jgi:peptidoglycan-associated lipoprotein